MSDIFSPAALDRLVKDLPSDIAPGEKVIVGTVDEKGAKVSARLAFDGNWQLEAAIRHDWTGDTAAGVKVIKRWK